MTSTQERGGPDHDAAPPAKISQPADHGQRSAPDRSVVDVPAWAFKPSGRRFGWLWLVIRCPYCSDQAVASAHAHRGGAIGGVRAAGCGRGEYRLVRTYRGWAA